MSTPTTPSATAPRRVRHQVRDAAVVMAFSAGLSALGALVLLLLAHVAAGAAPLAGAGPLGS